MRDPPKSRGGRGRGALPRRSVFSGARRNGADPSAAGTPERDRPHRAGDAPRCLRAPRTRARGALSGGARRALVAPLARQHPRASPPHGARRRRHLGPRDRGGGAARPPWARTGPSDVRRRGVARSGAAEDRLRRGARRVRGARSSARVGPGSAQDIRAGSGLSAARARAPRARARANSGSARGNPGEPDARCSADLDLAPNAGREAQGISPPRIRHGWGRGR